MFHTRIVLVIVTAGVFSLMAEDQASADRPWNKPVPAWTADDAHQVMTDSPWAKTTTPTMDRSASEGQRRSGGGGRGGGVNIGGIGVGLPGIGGMGRRGGGYPGGNPGGGYPGGGNPRGNYPDSGGRTESGGPPTLTLRWESALPVREAELKERDVDAPTVDENHYAIAVIGVPGNMLKAETRALEGELKKQAALKRDGKKDFKPSSVQILQRDDGPVIVYFFARSTEISKSDRRVEFEAQIGRLKFSEPFYIEDMVYDGKLAL
ncbi:MAG: hypothetical protein LAO55_22545 [Acidobacteriia bacterium]|nr:hypothetical protein [Terriglobia bacterium]